MSTSSAYLAFLTEQLAGLGGVRARRMFGGAGIFCDDVMIGLVIEEVLYFKADDASRGDFEAEGLEPFTYETKDGRRTVMSYWRAPERLFDEPDEMLAWARKALAAARRSAAPKKRAIAGSPAARSKTPRKTR